MKSDISVICGHWFVPTVMLRKSRAAPATVFVSIYGRGLVAHDGRVVQGPIRAIRFLLWMLAAQNRPVSTAELVDLMFSDDPDGGPDDAASIIRGLASQAKTIAASIGLVVSMKGHAGYEVKKPERAAA